MRVYYLTSKAHAISNIEQMRIKISLFDDLNDPFELMGFNLASKEQRKVWEHFRKYFTEKIGIVCFSSQWQNPVMWSHYADKHRGICLGFDVDDIILKKVNYINRRRSIQIGNSLNSHGINPEILSKVIRYKYKEWGYESEYRGIVPLEEADSSGLYFLPFSNEFSLKEIIIGSHCELTPSEFKRILSPYNHTVKVIKSRLAFQSFKVVRNRAIAEYKNIQTVKP